MWPLPGKRRLQPICRSIFDIISSQGQLKNPVKTARKWTQASCSWSYSIVRTNYSKRVKWKCFRNYVISKSCALSFPQFPKTPYNFFEIDSEALTNQKPIWGGWDCKGSVASFLQIECECKKDHSRGVGRGGSEGERQGVEAVGNEGIVHKKQCVENQ